MTSLDSARDRADGTVRPPGFQRLTSATKAAAITTVAAKKLQEFEDIFGALRPLIPEDVVKRHILPCLTLEPQLPIKKFAHEINEQRQLEYMEKFVDWHRRVAEPFANEVAAACIGEVERRMENGPIWGPVLQHFVEKVTPSYPEWYRADYVGHVSLKNLVKSKLESRGFSVSKVRAGALGFGFDLVFGDSEKKPAASRGVLLAAEAEVLGDDDDDLSSNGNDDSELFSDAEIRRGLPAIRVIRKARDRVAGVIVNHVIQDCQSMAARDETETVLAMDDIEDMATVVDVQREVEELAQVDIIAEHWEEILDEVSNSLRKQGFGAVRTGLDGDLEGRDPEEMSLLKITFPRK